MYGLCEEQERLLGRMTVRIDGNHTRALTHMMTRETRVRQTDDADYIK